MGSPVIVVSKLKSESLSLVKKIAEKGLTPDIVLLSEAVYMLVDKKQYLSGVKKAIECGARFFALSQDASKRGIEKMINDVEIIDYEGLVDLLLEKSRSVINL